MVIQCFACNKVRKFGKWIELHPVLYEQMEDEEFLYMLCPHCQALLNSLQMKNESIEFLSPRIDSLLAYK